MKGKRMGKKIIITLNENASLVLINALTESIAVLCDNMVPENSSYTIEYEDKPEVVNEQTP